MLTRRNLLKTVAGLLIPAPMIVRAETLMVLPKPFVVPQKFRYPLFGDSLTATVRFPDLTFRYSWSIMTSDLRFIWDGDLTSTDGPAKRLAWSYKGSDFVFSTEAVSQIGLIRPVFHRSFRTS